MRFLIKRILFLCGVIVTLPLILLCWIEKWLIHPLLKEKPNHIYVGCVEILSMTPTVIGKFMRVGFYWAVCDRVSPDCSILFGCMLMHREVSIGKGVSVGPFTYMGFVDIEDDVIFGGRVSIISGKYQHGRPGQRTEGNGDFVEEDERLRIGKNSWIGQDVVLMANVGENCTVGAGSVVYKDVPDNTTVLGNPARKVNLDAMNK